MSSNTKGKKKILVVAKNQEDLNAANIHLGKEHKLTLLDDLRDMEKIIEGEYDRKLFINNLKKFTSEKGRPPSYTEEWEIREKSKVIPIKFDVVLIDLINPLCSIPKQKSDNLKCWQLAYGFPLMLWMIRRKIQYIGLSAYEFFESEKIFHLALRFDKPFMVNKSKLVIHRSCKVKVGPLQEFNENAYIRDWEELLYILLHIKPC